MTPATAHPIDLILADPMIRAVMKADRIEVAEMKTLLCSVGRRLATSPGAVVDDGGLPNAAADAAQKYSMVAAASAGRTTYGSTQSW